MSRAARKQPAHASAAEWSLPSSLSVFGAEWAVEEVDQDALGEGLHGYSDFATRTIRVLKTLRGDKKREVLDHEESHAELWESGEHEFLVHKFGEDAGVALVEMLVELRQRVKRRCWQ